MTMHRRAPRTAYIAFFAAVFALGLFGSPAVRAVSALETGVGLTPAHFPRHDAGDVTDMYRIAGELGSVAVINVTWSDQERVTVSEQLVGLARRFGLKTLVQLDILKPGGTVLAPPAGVDASRFEGATFDAYAQEVQRLAQLKPNYLVIGTDVNRLLGQGTARYAEFAAGAKRAYDLAKAASPSTKVYVTFNWDIFTDASVSHGVPLSELRKFVDLFRPKMDMLAFTSVPNGKFRSPADIPANYFGDMAGFVASEPVVLQLAWPSGAGGQGAQAAFVERLSQLAAVLRPTLVLWPIMHDLDSVAPLATLGLYTSAGNAKTAAAKFAALGRAGRPVVGKAVAEPQSAASGRRDPTDRFGIYTSTLSGEQRTLLVSDPSREINHAHISPDGTKLAFTRYNVRNAQGIALETTSYVQTEIVLCASNGDDCRVIIPPRRGTLAANASWTPDGRALLFVTNDTPDRQPGIARYSLETGRITPFYQPKDLAMADPHLVRDVMVAPGSDPASQERISRLFVINRPGAAAGAGQVRELTSPKFDNSRRMDPPLGDHDPKLSPDARKVAVMRHFDQDVWGIVVVDTASGQEELISPPGSVDAVPEWSNDGRRLVFWHVNPAAPKKSGIFTMKPDGSDRTRVPLPAGYFYTMPAFVPGSETAGASRIIFSAQVNPEM